MFPPRIPHAPIVPPYLSHHTKCLRYIDSYTSTYLVDISRVDIHPPPPHHHLPPPIKRLRHNYLLGGYLNSHLYRLDKTVSHGDIHWLDSLDVNIADDLTESQQNKQLR